MARKRRVTAEVVEGARVAPLAVLRASEEAGLPPPETEYLFALPREWRLDFAWPTVLVALEVEGGVWTGGRHTRGSGFLGDIEKYNELALRGWHLLRLTPSQVNAGDLIPLLTRAAQAFATRGTEA